MKIILASDAHVVGNVLAERYLTSVGYEVVNLGAQTQLDEIVDALHVHPDALAVAIGSINGHLLADLRGLGPLRRNGLIPCPVLVGGNLGVGARRDRTAERRAILAAGVDSIVDSIEDLPGVLRTLALKRERRRAS